MAKIKMTVPDLNSKPFKDVIENSLYSINFRGLPRKHEHDIEIVVPEKMEIYGEDENDLSDINDVSVFKALYFKINSEPLEDFQITDFLNYQFYQSRNKALFLWFTKSMLIDYYRTYKYNNGPLGMDMRKYKFVMSWFANMERQYGDSLANPPEGATIEKIKLTSKMNINELTTYFENLLKAGKIISTKENLKKVLRATFLDKDGMPLSKETLNSYFNPSKKYNRSKKG